MCCYCNLSCNGIEIEITFNQGWHLLHLNMYYMMKTIIIHKWNLCEVSENAVIWHILLYNIVTVMSWKNHTYNGRDSILCAHRLWNVISHHMYVHMWLLYKKYFDKYIYEYITTCLHRKNILNAKPSLRILLTYV